MRPASATAADVAAGSRQPRSLRAARPRSRGLVACLPAGPADVSEHVSATPAPPFVLSQTAAKLARHARSPSLGCDAAMLGRHAADEKPTQGSTATPRLRRRPLAATSAAQAIARRGSAQRLWLTTSTLWPSGSRTNAP